MKTWKRIAIFGLTAAMSCSGSWLVYADEIPAGYDAETWERLQDNVLEYDEIENLVKEYNPSYQLLKQGIAYSAAPAIDTAAALREEADQFLEMAKEAKDGGDKVLEKNYKKAASALKKSANSIEKSIESGSRLMVNETEKMLISGVQSCMIGYNQVIVNLDTLDIGIELAEAAYTSSQRQMEIGMATELDVLNARKALDSAKSQRQALADTATELRQTLCIMTGWSYDAAPEIRGIPTPDLSRIDGMNPEADLEKALGNNYALIKIKNETTENSAQRNNKSRSITEAEEKIKTNLEASYQAVLQSQSFYEAANTAYQNALIIMNGNERKFEMGMIGRLEYLQAKLAFQNTKAETEMAAMDLTQAIETYYWAVEGLAEIQ